MRRNPDKTCWSCGILIIDRSKKSACYCKSCAAQRTLEYNQAYFKEYYKKVKQGMFNVAAGSLMLGLYYERQENLDRIIALSSMFANIKKKIEFGGNEL